MCFVKSEIILGPYFAIFGKTHLAICAHMSNATIYLNSERDGRSFGLTPSFAAQSESLD